MTKNTMNKTKEIRHGYEIDNQGRLRRNTVLELYYRKGFLELKNSPFSAEKRKKAGEILARDYFLGNYHNLRSVRFYESNIPTTGENGLEISLYYKNKYLNAMKSVPYEFWQVLYRVCIEDKKLISEEEKTKGSLRDKNNIFYQKMLLVLGLERLLKYYLQKNKKSS